MDIIETIPIILFFASLFGISYMFFTTRHRERMAMIDKGLDHRQHRPVQDQLRVLKNGLLAIGVGVGAIVGFLFQEAIAPDGMYGPLPYAVGVCLGGGAALVLFYSFFGRKSNP